MYNDNNLNKVLVLYETTKKEHEKRKNELIKYLTTTRMYNRISLREMASLTNFSHTTFNLFEKGKILINDSIIEAYIEVFEKKEIIWKVDI